MKPTLTERIDAILPQTQCTQCSYPDCKSYASAIAEGQADINQCPPGDTAGILKLARLLGVAPKPLNTTHGHPKPKAVALIDEAICIGCTFCIQVCPVDAIVGAAKQMHVVITAACTSCELCIAPCPMDCIQMIPVTKRVSYETREASITNAEREQDATDLARKRHQFKLRRLEHEQYEQKKRHTQKIHTNQYNFDCLSTNYHKKAAIRSAQLRAAAVRKAANSNQGTVVVER